MELKSVIEPKWHRTQSQWCNGVIFGLSMLFLKTTTLRLRPPYLS